MRSVLFFIVLLSPLTTVFAQPDPSEHVTEQTFSSGGKIRLHLEAGGYTIQPTDSEKIVVRFHTNSDEKQNQTKVRIEPGASTANVYISNTPRNHFTATIEVPRRSNLWVRLSAGDLSVEDVDGDKNIEMWAGQMSITVAHPEAYGHRDASVVAGSLEASAFNISKGGLFRSFREEGPGKNSFHAHVTTGEIDIRKSN
jgi:hypothetical protein